MTGLAELASQIPPSLRYSKYLENSGLAVAFFFLLFSNKLQSGCTFLTFLICLSVRSTFTGKSPEEFAGNDVDLIILGSGGRLSRMVDSLINCSYPRRPFLLFIALNMPRNCREKRDIVVDCEVEDGGMRGRLKVSQAGDLLG